MFMWDGTEIEFMLCYGWFALSVAFLPVLIGELIRMLRKPKK